MDGGCLDNKVYRHNNDDDLSIAETFTVPELSITGLASDGKSLYSCDTAKGKIYKHRLDDKLSVEAAYDTPGKNPCGLFFDGKKSLERGQQNQPHLPP